jgi:hypothetical protein
MNTIALPKQFWKTSQIKKDKQTVGFISGLFGCRHKELSVPMTVEKESYRACTNCGARRAFNPKTLETSGSFYFPQQLNNNQTEINSF